jgi:hypothetical protein
MDDATRKNNADLHADTSGKGEPASNLPDDTLADDRDHTPISNIPVDSAARDLGDVSAGDMDQNRDTSGTTI